MRSRLFAFAAFVLSGAMSAQTFDHSPQLLLTPQRLRRLKRDRERQTVRWLDFANRVQAVPDSPQRGFELALYYAITGDGKRGREAVQWALAHGCEARQVALVLDWAWDQASEAERAKLEAHACAPAGVPAAILARDQLFLQIASGQDAEPSLAPAWKSLLSSLEQSKFQQDELYAACEYLIVVRATQRLDLRKDAPEFFSKLPVEFLLALDPNQVEHPGWMTHIAALALVDLDPNLESSQYLQGWAMEDRQMIRQGPGAAYELLWADPYLPGVGYQNLDPWVYDAAGRLFARTGWMPDACWIAIRGPDVQEANCPAKWKETAAVFGHMTLIPMTPGCIEAPRRKNNETAILWKLRPRQTVSYVEAKQRLSAEADAAGMWRLPANVEGKVCAP